MKPLKKIAVYGAGGFGRETMLMLEQINFSKPSWEISGFFDDGMHAGSVVGKWKVLGGLNLVNTLREETYLVIAIADPAVRRAVVTKIINPNIHYPVMVHPHCLVGSASNRFGKGCILTAGTILTTEINLEEFVIVNLSVTLGHDVRIGKFATIMPGCNISGNVRIGEECMIGTGAKILQNLSIGKQCAVGAGAVVTQHFPDKKTIVGIPAHEK